MRLVFNVLLPTFRHALGHYIVVPRAERTRLHSAVQQMEYLATVQQMEYLGEIGLERFAGDVQAKIVKGGLAGSAFVCVSRRQFLRLHGKAFQSVARVDAFPQVT